MRSRMLPAAVAVLASTVVLTPPTARAAGNVLVVDDVVNLESAGQFDLSPDGASVVWVKTTPNPAKNNRRSNVFLSPAAGGPAVQLTRGDQSDQEPRFSPDGRKVAFRSARGEKSKPQIYVLDLRGGEPERVTSMENGVESFDWLDDHTFVFSAREDSTLRERTLASDKDDVVVAADMEHYAPVRLFVHDQSAKKTRRLTTNPGVILEFALSPDRRRIVTNENQDLNYRYNYDHPPRQFLTDVTSGERREICTKPWVDPSSFRWDKDGAGFYCARDIAGDPANSFVAIRRLFYFDLAADSLRAVPTGWDNGLGGDYVAVDDGVLVSLADGVTDRIAYISGGSRHFVATERPVHLVASRADSRRVVYAQSDASTVPVYMTATLHDGSLEDPKQLVDLNEPLKKKTLSETAIVKWAGARGDSVDGILYYPPGYDSTRTYPLVVWIHGGPSGHDPDYFTERWSCYPHVLSAKGTFVLRVNYHGSDNYGLAWMESIKGHYYELEVPDILTGIDYLEASGLTDKDRVGVMGWSNGSILAIQCCLASPRFKALCAGAGDVNWTSDYGNCAFGAAFDDDYFGGPPWKLPQVYVEKSPLFQMEKLKTPTLIMFGAEDTNVPTEQGWQHFRAMQTIGIAPVRFLLFPGTGHGLVKLAHQRRKMNEELAWLDTYLFGTPATHNEALDDGSPLAFALARAKVARVGHLVGREYDASLVPETVEVDGLAVGRFEVTRAQFAAFDPNYTVDAGEDNLPVTDVSLPLAQAYCLWLSQKTGETYRLPTAAEMDKLLAAAKPVLAHENTLERWVGYRPTPDELALLRATIEELERTRTLLEPVGSFRPAGAGGVYDAGGNAAEWCTGDDGVGVIKGYSAVTCADEKDGAMRPPMSYVGFRVVRP